MTAPVHLRRLFLGPLFALVLTGSAPQAEEFAPIAFGPKLALYPEQGEKHPFTVVVDGGFLHGFAPGMKVPVFTVPAGDEAPREIGLFEVAYVLAYETTGELQPNFDDAATDSLIRFSRALSIDIPDRPPDSLIGIALAAMENGEWKLSKHYWSSYLDCRPADTLAIQAVEECSIQIEAEETRPLTDRELFAARMARERKYFLAHDYMARRKFDHAREKIREIRRASPDDYGAGLLADRIERLQSLDSNRIYRPQDDPARREVNLVPAWPLPGQPDYAELWTAYSRLDPPLCAQVLIDTNGTPLLVRDMSQDRTPISGEALLILFRTIFTPGLRNGEPVIMWTDLTFGEETPQPEAAPSEADSVGFEMLYVRLLEPDSGVELLVIADGGYLDGLHDGLRGKIQGSNADGQPITVAAVEILDVDRYQSWCRARIEPGIDPRISERTIVLGRRVAFGQPRDPLDSLLQRAVGAMGSADYETAAALLTLVLREQPDHPSAASALNRCLVKLAAVEEQPLSEDQLAFEHRYLSLYNDLLKTYYDRGDFDRTRQMAKRISRIAPDHNLPPQYIAACDQRDSLAATGIGPEQLRIVLTPKRFVFPPSFESLLPPEIPPADLDGVVRAHFGLDDGNWGKFANAKASLLASCGNSALDKIALDRVEKSKWQDYAVRTCIVDFRHAADSVVLVYGVLPDESEKGRPRPSPSMNPPAAPATYVSEVEATLLYVHPADLPEELALASAKPLLLNLLINERGEVEAVEKVKSSGNKKFDKAVQVATEKYRFASGTPDGSPERFWVGCVVFPPKPAAL